MERANDLAGRARLTMRLYLVACLFLLPLLFKSYPDVYESGETIARRYWPAVGDYVLENERQNLPAYFRHFRSDGPAATAEEPGHVLHLERVAQLLEFVRTLGSLEDVSRTAAERELDGVNPTPTPRPASEIRTLAWKELRQAALQLQTAYSEAKGSKTTTFLELRQRTRGRVSLPVISLNIRPDTGFLLIEIASVALLLYVLVVIPELRAEIAANPGRPHTDWLPFHEGWLSRFAFILWLGIPCVVAFWLVFTDIDVKDSSSWKAACGFWAGQVALACTISAQTASAPDW